MLVAPKSRRILYIQYTNPGGYPPLLHSSEILAAQGWQVLFLGTGAFGVESLTISQHPNIRCRQKRFCAPGWKQKIHYLWFSVWCVYWACRWRPDWIYASDLWSCIPSMLIHRMLGVPVVYHEHDAPVPYHNGMGSLFLRFTYWARRQCAHLADLCVIPNENRAKLFQAETGVARIKVAWNCPAVDEVTPPKDGAGSVLKLLYHGSIVPERLPLAVIHALKNVSHPVVLKVVGYETTGSRGYVARIERTAAELGISGRLAIVGTLSTRREMMEVCATCDVGLSLMPIRNEDANLANMTGASNKPFDYLACGLAVLVSRLPAWQELFVKNGYGLDCDPSDPASIAATIQFFCDHPEEVRAMGERGRQRILSEWNYQAQFRDILQLLSQKLEIPISNPAEQRCKGVPGS